MKSIWSCTVYLLFMDVKAWMTSVRCDTHRRGLKREHQVHPGRLVFARWRRRRRLKRSHYNPWHTDRFTNRPTHGAIDQQLMYWQRKSMQMLLTFIAAETCWTVRQTQPMGERPHPDMLNQVRSRLLCLKSGPSTITKPDLMTWCWSEVFKLNWDFGI